MFTGICIGFVLGLCVTASKPELAFLVREKVAAAWGYARGMFDKKPPTT
jgi:hypothetical protein